MSLENRIQNTYYNFLKIALSANIRIVLIQCKNYSTIANSLPNYKEKTTETGMFVVVFVGCCCFVGLVNCLVDIILGLHFHFFTADIFILMKEQAYYITQNVFMLIDKPSNSKNF